MEKLIISRKLCFQSCLEKGWAPVPRCVACVSGERSCCSVLETSLFFFPKFPGKAGAEEKGESRPWLSLHFFCPLPSGLWILPGS